MMELLTVLARCLFHWKERYPTWDELDTLIRRYEKNGIAVVIVTHDIGLSKGRVAGIGNDLMARSLQKAHCRWPHLPILPQVGLAIASRNLGIPVTQEIGPPTSTTRMDTSTPSYNTFSVIEDQRSWCIEHNQWPAVGIALTSPYHITRVLDEMRRAGFIKVVPLPLETYDQAAYLDPNSLYWELRLAARLPYGKYIYLMRELLLGRILGRAIYDLNRRRKNRS